MVPNNQKRILARIKQEKRWIRIIWICFILLSSSVISQAQDYLPNILPPSPEASSITQYVDFKISEYTGAVSHNIPIHTYQEGDVKVPISLSYHGAGFPVSTVASRAGLGWTLLAGGAVSRAMVGQPDDINGFLSLAGSSWGSETVDHNYLMAGPNDQSRLGLLREIGEGCKDSQPDIFNFNFNGISGRFYFDWDKNIVVSSTSKVSVTPLWEGVAMDSELAGWVITAGNGFTYRFEAVERTSIISTSIQRCGISPIQAYNSSWYLTQISNAADTRHIYFDYESYTQEDHNIFHSISRSHNLSPNSVCGGTTTGTDSQNQSNVTIYGQHLSKVRGSHNQMVIDLAPGVARTDLSGSNMNVLGAIEIKNGSDLIRKFSLSHGYSTGRLTLVSLQESNGVSELPPYRFYYHGALPGRGSNAYDHWGFANDNQSDEAFPSYVVNHLSGIDELYGGADRSPSLAGSKKGMLYKIVYPTGGFDTYTFELNEYRFVNDVELDEYITVKKSKEVESLGTTNQCSGGTPLTTTMNEEYFIISPKPGGISYQAQVNVRLDIAYFQDKYLGANMPPAVTILDADGTEIASYSEGFQHDGEPFVLFLSPGTYTMQTEASFKCDEFVDKAFIKVSYEDYTGYKMDSKYTGGVRVSKIEKHEDYGAPSKSIDYEYTQDNGHSSGFIYDEPNYIYSSSSYVASGSLSDVECPFLLVLQSNRHSVATTQGSHIGYKQVKLIEGDGTNGYQVLNFSTKADLIYQAPPFQPAVSSSYATGLIDLTQVKNANGDLVKEIDTDYRSKSYTTQVLKVGYKGSNGSLQDHHFNLGSYVVKIGHVQTSEVMSTMYNDGTDVVSTVSHTYDSNNQLLIESEMQTSTKSEITRNYYAGDVNNPNSEIQDMITDGLTGLPIETLKLVKDPDGNRVIGGNSFEYSSGKLISVDELTISEKIPEALLNLRINNNGVKDYRYNVSAMKIAYDLVSNPVQVDDNSEVPTAYIWGYHDTYPIAKVEGANYSYISSYVSNLQNLSDADNDRCLDSESCNEKSLRSALNHFRKDPLLKDVRITTYTHDLGVGMTSQTDPNGNTTYYNYDELGRLLSVKDQDANIIEEHSYKYRTQ